MPDSFLSSEEYDEQAHQLYNSGDYEGALRMLKEGLSLYPGSVDLCVGLGYARLAREEFAWARAAFERALVLDPGHEDGMVGLGEALLRFGEHDRALKLFDEVERLGYVDDVELILTVGRALYREQMYPEARDVFARAAAGFPDNAEAAASMGYCLHRLGDELGASRQIRRALRLDPDLHEARIYRGHLLHDRGDWEGALREFERVPPVEHWDPIAVWRIMELKRALWHMEEGDARLRPWRERLRTLEAIDDPIDRMLAEIEAEANGRPLFAIDPSQLELFQEEPDDEVREVHLVRTSEGVVHRGSWSQIVRRMQIEAGFGHETLLDYMRRVAEGWHEGHGVEVSFQDPESFIRTAVAHRLLFLEDDR